MRDVNGANSRQARVLIAARTNRLNARRLSKWFYAASFSSDSHVEHYGGHIAIHGRQLAI